MQDISRRFNLIMENEKIPDEALNSLSKISETSINCLAEQLASFTNTYFNQFDFSASYKSIMINADTSLKFEAILPLHGNEP